MSSHEYGEESGSSTSFRFLLVNFDSEDPEKYQHGGLHPVHLGDYYDNGRYKIVHKLGFGGFSTVWLARDKVQHTWVALKIVVADQSSSAAAELLLSSHAALKSNNGASIIVAYRHFIFHGPNGHHLCLVQPVLGPSTSQMANAFASRIQPRVSRRAGRQATKALAVLHSQDICHGGESLQKLHFVAHSQSIVDLVDVTTANIIFSLRSLDCYTETDIYRMFGSPTTDSLETESGERLGPEAPRYIVQALNFLSSSENLVSDNVKLIDFDQSFPVKSPPKAMLGTPVEFLAPEVAMGHDPGPASDVWALGCSIFRLRSGESPFSGYEVTSPVDLMRVIIQALGDPPSSWGSTLFDYYGQPTQDPVKGRPLEKLNDERKVRDLVHKIWDQPKHDVIASDDVELEHRLSSDDKVIPYPPCFSHLFWKPTATRINGTYLHGYDDETDRLLQAMPKISDTEAALLYDLLSKIFVYDPSKRITAAEMLCHPWFHMVE